MALDRREAGSIVVVGAGPAGLLAALALEAAGFQPHLVGPAPMREQGRTDSRTTALFGASVTLLDSLDVGHCLEESGAAIRAIRIVDDTGRLVRAPEVVFQAGELGLEAFGYNISNRALVAALEARAARPGSAVTRLECAVSRIEPLEDRVAVHVEGHDRPLSAGLVVGADGRGSLCRRAAGIDARTWPYPQVAIACNFAHTRPHQHVSNEFHRCAGPFTTVPLPGLMSSLVWVEAPDEAERVLALPDSELAEAIEARSQGLLGRVTSVGPRSSFPLSGLKVARLGARRVALVGEAGHVVPPIGAQGLNLACRDVLALTEGLADALAAGRDPGARETLHAYDRSRRRDIESRTFGVDALNRTLMSDLLPAQLARGLGLGLLANLPFLRRLAMQEGLGPSLRPTWLRSPRVSTGSAVRDPTAT